jgi:hypothetical protein
VTSSDKKITLKTLDREIITVLPHHPDLFLSYSLIFLLLSSLMLKYKQPYPSFSARYKPDLELLPYLLLPPTFNHP